MRRWSSLLALAFLAAGCSEAAVESPSAAPSPRPTAPKDDAGSSAGPSLEAAPAWRTGDWWTVRFREAYTGKSFDVTLVVAGNETEHHLLGMPADQWVDAPLIFFWPGMGLVRKADLATWAHDRYFTFLEFPLSAGRQWPVVFAGASGTARVAQLDGLRARVEIHATADGAIHYWANVTYDAAAAFVVSSDLGDATTQLVARGANFTGRVLVPTDQRTVLGGARFAMLDDVPPSNPNPRDTATVAAGFQGLSLGLLVGAPPEEGQDVPQTYYRETVTAPDGTVYELVAQPTDPPGRFRSSFHRHAKDPAGPWTMDHVAAGPGLAFANGVAYGLRDVVLA